jgi:hypothetical protein
MDTFAQRFEAMMDDKRVRVVGIALSALVLAISMGLLVAAKSPMKPIVTGKVLPDAPVNVPLLRSMPYPDLRASELRALLPAATARISASSVAPKGKLVLSRR